MPCPTCGAETRPGQRFCMDCGALLEPTPQGTTPASTATVQLPATPGGPVPIRIVEQTTPLPVITPPAAVAPVPTAIPIVNPSPPMHEVSGMVWHPIAHDPWPTPRSSPTVVAGALNSGRVVVAGLAAAVLGIAGSIVSAGSYRFADGTDVRFTLDDLRSNSLGVMVAVAAVLLVGVALSVGRQRIGIGLTGGAAVALAGLAAMDAALIVAQLVEARRAGLAATGLVTITWEPGFYLIVGGCVVGLVAAAFALGVRRDAEVSVPVAFGVLGIVASTVMVCGALIPADGGSWGDNLGITGFGAVPSWLRLGALAVVGAAGIVGFASRRRSALGLSFGCTAALAAQWIGVLDPPVPNRRGGPGIAISPLVDTALTVNAAALVAVVALALAGWLVTARRPR